MSNKRLGQDGQSPPRVAGKRPRRGDKRHLYLVLDDWDNGYSIHKIDADSFDTCDDGGGVAGHLPEPPALRLESPAGKVPHNGMSFAALGTKIFAFMTQRCGLVYDSGTATLAVAAHAPARMLCGFGITVAVGEVIYALTYRFADSHHSFEAMSWEEQGWSWKTLPPPPSTFRGRVNAYALHPDGRTIFMTSADNKGRLGTYSFNTKDSAWSWHGEWALPFTGQAHFDAETNSWVGLLWNGCICSCKVVSPDCLNTAAPDWEMTKEKFLDEDSRRHMRASLISMGTNKFCLVQCVRREQLEDDQVLGDCDGFTLHLTIFGLKYNHKGELQTTRHQSTRSFIVSRHTNHFGPKAFWM